MHSFVGGDTHPPFGEPPLRAKTARMASGLLLLLDDIASVLDDVATLTKVATKKTAGVLGDDLALNAEQVAGVRADRELPVVWAVAKGSARNKAILIPAALLLSSLLPAVITPLLLLGGLFLCFEGAEKLLHRFVAHGEDGHDAALRAALLDPEADLAAIEAERIRGAVRTDFILSAEIVVIVLGSVREAPLLTQTLVLCGIGVLMTLGVYGLVAAIVRLDDAGVALQQVRGRATQAAGAALLWVAPQLMRALSVLGTAAMFLVGGGIVVHALPPLHHWSEAWDGLALMAIQGGVGLLAGAVVVALVTAARRLKAG